MAFYARETAVVAREMLGAIIECTTADGRTSGRIVETEAYLGPHDPACHAAAGVTARTKVLYGPPGRAYMYFIYGMYWCVNAVTQPKGFGSAVLIRAVEPIDGVALMRRRRPAARRDVDLTNGPGKLCTAMGMDGRMNGIRLDRAPLVIRVGDAVPADQVVVTPRIGIRVAAHWPQRYFVKDNPYVSRTPADFPRTSYAHG